MTKDTVAARDVALAALVNIEKNQAYSGLALQAETRRYSLSERDERLVWRLVYGVVSHSLSLDYILDQFCRRRVSTLSPSLRNTLRMACYQLVYLDRIPDFAAVNEAVTRARKTAGSGMAGFVNGVLRNVLRNREGLFENLPADPTQAISIRYSHPAWLVDKWVKSWGSEFTAALCAANNEPVPLTVRVNTTRVTVERFIAASNEKGLNPAQGKYCPQAVVFPADTPFSQVPGFKEGWFLVQGEASMLPAQCLEIHAGQDVLDMCSAPGGKATQMAAAAFPGQVTACDLYQARLKLVAENAARLGQKNIITVQGDAAQLDRTLTQGFDRILLDAPCSGLGVIRKKPDIKWTRQAKDLAELAALQQKILNSACNLLNPGGILVYSTCTLTHEENQGVIRSLLQQRRDLKLVNPGWPELTNPEGFIITYPHLHGLDGFFIAKLIKVV